MLVMDADHQGTDEDDTCSLHAIANVLSLALGNCLEEGFSTMFPHRDRTSDHPNGIKQRCILKVFHARDPSMVSISSVPVLHLVSS